MSTSSQQRPVGAQERRAPTPAASADRAPSLADGVELLGEYRDSGLREPPYVARRADGQMVQLSQLLHVVAEQADGRRDYAEIAERVAAELGRKVSADNVRYLVDEKLRPLGVLAEANGTSPAVAKADPLLALRFRAAVVPARVTRALTTLFLPFFFPPVLVAVVAGIVAVDVWFFFQHGVAQSTRAVIYNPLLLLMVLGLVVVATALHELGHATAARYGGAEPGVMGAGVYVVWPAFYTDVTDAYRLGRGGRLRTDLGGIYFNGVFVLAIAAAYALTGFEPLLLLILIQHLQVLQQLLPFLRLDGYYVLSDLTGVPDLFARIKPTLRSVVPGRPTDARVEELKPWVRLVTTGWVIALIPVLLFAFGMLVFNAPRMLATAHDSLGRHTDRVGDALSAGNAAAAAVASIQIVALVLPLAGMTYSFGRVFTRVVGGAWSWSEGAPLRRAVIAASTVAAVAAGAYVLVPNGDYQPIRETERGTLTGGVDQLRRIGGGRPAVSDDQRDLRESEPQSRPGQDGERRQEDRGDGRASTPAGTTTTEAEPAAETEPSTTATTTTPAATETTTETAVETPPETVDEPTTETTGTTETTP